MKTLKGKLAMLFLIAFTCLAMGAWAQTEGGHRNGKRNHGSYGQHRKHHGKNYLHKNELLSNRINRVTQADSIQTKSMKPIIEKTSEHLNALRTDFQQKRSLVMDSLKLQLKLILKEDQLQKYEEFNKKSGRNNWR